MKKPDSCQSCALGRQFKNKEGDLITLGKSFSNTEGKPSLGVHLVGEALGPHEAQEGLPFRRNSDSGSLISKIVEDITWPDPVTKEPRKLKREDFNWDNIGRCQPPGNKLAGESYEKSVVDSCRVYDDRSFGLSNSYDYGKFNKVIVALGGVAFRTLTGIQGKKRTIDDIRGYVFRSYNFNALVVGSLHPSFIRHGNASKTLALEHDIKKALLVADGRFTSYIDHPNWKSPIFVTDGKLDALVSLYYKLRDNPQLTLYCDIENPYSKLEEEDEKGEEEDEENSNTGKEPSYEITSIQFGTSKDWAITVPWEKPFIKVAIKILALENPKVGANFWHHDQPRLESNGAKLAGVVHDLMWAWHHYQPGLWKGLQRIASFHGVPYAWKHLALEEGNEDEYGGMDVIAPAYIWPRLVGKMKKVGVWESYLKFKVKYRYEVLAPAEKRGMPVSLEEHENFKEWVKGEVSKEDDYLQLGIPQSLRQLTPKRKIKTSEQGESGFSFGYLREPSIIRQLRTGYLATYNKLIERGIEPSSIISFERYASAKTGLTLRQFESSGGNGNQELDGSEKVERWCRVEPFKASSQQLIKYLKFKGYEVPKTLKTKRETTGKKELQELWEKTGDDNLGRVIRLRSYSKMLSNDIPNWLPDKDGVVRTTFLFDPPNWQLNSRSPNIQNASKHAKEWELFGRPAGELQLIGQRFRKIVKAPKGRCVVEFDKSAFHAVIMGWIARDPSYIRAAKLDLHTILTSYIVKQPIDLGWSDGHIRDAIQIIKKEFKTIRNSQAKPTGLGNQLGLGAHKLWHMNKTYIDEKGNRQVGIANINAARKFQEILAGLFPKVDRIKKKIQEEAHFKGFLMSPYGCIRWFHDVLRWDWKTRQMKRASEAEEAIGHAVQAPAFGHIHSEIIEMGEQSDVLEEHWFCNTVHDSLVFFPEIGKLDRCIGEVLGFMLKPDLVLKEPICSPDGLVVGVDVSASPVEGNWASFDKNWNPIGIRELKI